jgi:hypothetical protein
MRGWWFLVLLLSVVGGRCFALAPGYSSAEAKVFGFFQYGGDIPHPRWELGSQGHNSYELPEAAIVFEKNHSFTGSYNDGKFTFTGSCTPDLKTLVELTVTHSTPVREDGGIGKFAFSFTVANVPLFGFTQSESDPFKICVFQILGTDAEKVKEVLQRVKKVTFTREFPNGKRIYLEKILDKFIHDPSIYSNPMGFRNVVSRYRIPGIICKLKLWPPNLQVDFRRNTPAKSKVQTKPQKAPGKKKTKKK